MRITRILGENIASLAQPFDVDFTQEPLHSCGIFAITGPTGAGKSTLLDVICLALYNNTPRLASAESERVYEEMPGANLLSYGDPRNLLHRGAAEGRAEVCFDVNGTHYKAGWYVRRAGKKVSGQLQQVEMSLVNLSQGTEYQGRKTEILAQIKELIGLSFEQFTKAVMLAQGDFASFLFAKENEKGETLMRITGTELFSRIGTEIFNQNSEAVAALKELQQRAEHIELPSQEACEHLACEIKEDKEQLAKANKIYQDASAQLYIIDDYIHRLGQWEDSRRELTTLLTQYRPLASSVSKRIYLRRLLAYKDKLRLLQNIENRIALLTKEQQEKESRFHTLSANKADVQEKLDEANHYFTAWAQQNTEKEPLLQQAVDLERQAALLSGQITELAHQLKENEKEQEKLELKIRDTQSQLSDNEAEILTIQEWITAHQAERPYIDQAPQHLLALSEVVECIKEEARSSIQIAESNKRLVEEEEEQQQLTEKLKDYSVFITEAVAQLRQCLIPGEACPVCGSTTHPHADAALHAVVVKNEEEAIRKRKDLEERINILQQHNKERYAEVTALKRLKDQANSRALQLINQERETIQALLQIAQIDHSSPFEKYAEQIAARTSEWLEKLKKIDTLKQQKELLDKEYHLLLEQKHKEAKAQSFLTEEKNKKSTTLIDCKEGVSPLLGFSSVAQYQEAIQKEEKTQKELITQLTNALTALTTEERSLLERLSAIRHELSSEHKNKKMEADATQQERLALEGHFGVTEEHFPKVDEALLQKEEKLYTTLSDEWNRLKARYRERATEIHAAEEKLPRLQQARFQNSLDALRSEAAHSVDVGHTHIQELMGLITRKESTLEQYHATIASYKELAIQIESARQYAARWDELNRFFGSKDGYKFNNIAQGYTLDYLLLHANQYLNLLAPRYQLIRTPDKLLLEVIDRDMLGERRTINSLSGGETFLVSLALSLALSSISSMSISIDSLFIDEGFGALDEDTLNTAMGAFEVLQASGRKIGIISHVKEVMQRVAVRIEVDKQGNGESLLRIISDSNNI